MPSTTPGYRYSPRTDSFRRGDADLPCVLAGELRARRSRQARATGVVGPRGTRPLPGGGWAPSGRARSAIAGRERVATTPVARACRPRLAAPGGLATASASAMVEW